MEEYARSPLETASQHLIRSFLVSRDTNPASSQPPGIMYVFPKLIPVTVGLSV